jgi:hypothetical protein
MRAPKHAVSVAVVVLAVLAASQVAPFVAGAHAQDVRPRMATNTPRLQLFQGDGRNFMLVDPLFYEIKRTGKTITVPAGFVTDFASVPWYARSLISVLGRHSIPAIVHDYLYWEQRCTRDQADDILREAMNEYSSSWRDQIAVDYAVKYGAQGAWDQNKADRKKGYVRVLTGSNQNIPLNMDWDTYRQQLFKQHANEPPPGPSNPDYCVLPAKVTALTSTARNFPILPRESRPRVENRRTWPSSDQPSPHIYILISTSDGWRGPHRH